MTLKPLLFLVVSGCAAVRPTVETPVHLGPVEARAVVVVRVPSPWWAPNFVITNKFVEAIPDYARAPGLEHKAFTMSEDRRFGGVYLWKSRADAEKWFDTAWHERVKAKRGVDGDVQVLDARATVWGDATPKGTALPQHALKTDAVVTWLRLKPTPESVETRLEQLAVRHGTAPGLLRVSFVSESDGSVGAVALWNTADAAHSFWSTQRTAQFGGEVLWFTAPVLLDAAAEQREVAVRP